MSEDEAIKKLQEMIGLCTEKPKHIAYNEQRAIETLLDLYKKEKENNKTLEELLQGRLFELYNYYKDLAGSYQANCISKDKIKEKIKRIEEIYKEEMKPYQTKYGLNVSFLNKKEKEELINKRNSLLTQIEAYKLLLEEE